MKLLTTLKTLPLVSILALGLALAPTASMADKGDRGQKERYSQHGGKSFKGDKRGHKDRGHGYGHTKKGHDKHGYDRHGSHGRHQVGHAHGHGHDRHAHHNSYAGHSHNNYIVRDYGNQHYLGLGNLRFMLGLHTDNVDIIFRD